VRRYSFADTFANQADGSTICVTCAAPPIVWRLL
jgi:hypothetical protein